MKIKDKLDLGFLYKNGYYRSDIDLASADEALNIIKSETFVEDKEAAAIVLNPVWDNTKSVEPKSFPSFYTEFLERFLATGFLKDYEALYGKFTSFNVAINKCPPGYINRWHGHFMDGYHLHLLFHFSPEEKTLEDGGLIEFGLIMDPNEYHLNFRDYNQIDLKNVFQTGSFISKHGQFEVLLNTHPMYAHQVTEVLSSKERYTLMIFLGYTDNILINKKDINNL